MKKYLITASMAAILACGTAASASAHDWWWHNDSNNTDITQVLDGLQVALDKIDNDNGSSSNITQTATNAGNLIDVNQDLDDVVQHSYTPQKAINKATTNSGSWANLTQAATNVVNSLSDTSTVRTPEVSTVEQKATRHQFALNVVTFNDTLNGVAKTDPNGPNWDQSAANIANTVTLESLGDQSRQLGLLHQTAVNYAGSTGYQPNATVYGFDQSSVNGVNLLTADALPSSSHQLEVGQFSFGTQWASNKIDAVGAVNSVVQSATNIANSVTMPIPSN